MQLLEDPFFSRRLPAPEQHRRPIAAQIAEKEAEERSSRSLAAHDSGSSEGDNETARCEVRTRSVRVNCFQFCPGNRWRFWPDGCIAVTAPKLQSPWKRVFQSHDHAMECALAQRSFVDRRVGGISASAM